MTKFKGKTVTIVGLGGLGSTLTNRLVRLGAKLRIIDRDRIYEKEFSRLSLFSKSVLNKFKAKEAKKVLDAIDEQAEVKAFHEDLVAENSFLLKGDVVIDASNDIKTNSIVAEHAKINKIPVIQANYADAEAIITYYQNTHNPVKFTKTIAKNGIAEPLTELVASAVLYEMKLLFEGKKPKPSINIDAKNLIIK